MKTRLAATTLIVGASLFASPYSAEARQPYIGSFSGTETRKVDKAKPKKRKLAATATTVQSGPTNYDTRSTITATGGGEKLVIVLDLDAANNGTLTINGTVVAAPGAKTRQPRAAAKKLKIRLKASGTAVFVGPLAQKIAMKGRSGSVPFKVTGTMDLDATGGLILDLKVTFEKPTPLGKKAAFSFLGARS